MEPFITAITNTHYLIQRLLIADERVIICGYVIVKCKLRPVRSLLSNDVYSVLIIISSSPVNILKPLIFLGLLSICI